MKLAEEVRELIESVARERGYYIVDITYKREGRRFVLRVTVDKAGGIALDECARLNNELSELFDRENIIEEQYVLEVSSPGLDRRLKTEGDFVWAVGKQVRVTTFAPLDGKNVFTGVLLGLGDSTVVVEENGASTEIPKEKIASAKLAYKG